MMIQLIFGKPMINNLGWVIGTYTYLNSRTDFLPVFADILVDPKPPIKVKTSAVFYFSVLIYV